MGDEYFYGAILKGKNASVVWDPPQEEKLHYELAHPAKLLIKQAVLGSDAIEGEINTVQVETVTNSSEIKLPIAILKNDSVNHVSLDLAFLDQTTFTLVQGSGPVYIAGLQLMAREESDDSGDSSDDEDSMPDEENVIWR